MKKKQPYSDEQLKRDLRIGMIGSTLGFVLAIIAMVLALTERM